MGIAVGTFIATGVLFVVLPKGFFPSEDIGQALITVEAVEDISFPAMAELLQRTGSVIRANPAVDTLIVNASESNSARLFMTLKPRSERPHLDKIIESLRRDVRAIPGVNVFINPIQNLRLGGRTSKSRYQYVMRSVHAEELRRPPTASCRACVTIPIFRDVTSDSQLKGLQARLNINRDKVNLLGVQMADIRSTSTARLANARFRPSTLPATAIRSSCR